MLVLSRFQDESVIITVPPSTKAKRIRVVMMKSEQGKARLGFDADRDVVIHRQEVQEAVDGQK